MSALSSVHRALQVLEVVAAAGDGITAKAVARRLEYNLSTTYHLLDSLVSDGYLVRLEASRGFGLGPKLPALHDRLVAQLPVPRGLGGILGEVHGTAGAGALYAAFRDDDVVVVAHDDCAEHPVPVISTWRGALHATAVGKLWLAECGAAERRAVLDRDGLPAHAYRTMTDPAELERELDAVRRRDLAVDRGELRERLACMAAPVRVPGADGPVLVGAVAVAVPVVPAGGPGSIADRRDRLERAVREGARRLAVALQDPVSTGWDDGGPGAVRRG
ncbi:IclR family transcriptional regulator [Actinomycetospora lemnae]|uniref:IclR family transcriptional regulator C-terminal domain-containing protein n=1 Tax=Actinomycetospora lemnae TaxID=3019891 RepID=A0ABT5STR3_9PSEU|nr:IclR family transcriptional regulator C-terminal domain-containing protein [Actinomycetospora sp. DW7H6]MDD7966250.1 IclR family transcriptional regulator C-terminal domain-containing protein [Actinomycetospora sp. DW7H6]